MEAGGRVTDQGMTKTLSKPEAYCFARLRGLDMMQASAEAGYSSQPAPEARELWEIVQAEYGNWDRRTFAAMDAEQQKLQARRDHLKEQLDEVDKELKRHRVWLKALRILERA